MVKQALKLCCFFWLSLVIIHGLWLYVRNLCYNLLFLSHKCNIYFYCIAQASRVLKLERYSLQYLLQQLCEVTANKEYAVFISFLYLSPFFLSTVLNYYILEGWQFISLQVPECRLESTPSSWCDDKVNLRFELATINLFLIHPVTV